MVLRVPEAPESARRAARAVLDSRESLPADCRTDQAALTAGFPHRVFEIDLLDLVSERGVRSARQVGWRWLMWSGDTVVGGIEVRTGPTGHGVGRFVEGPFTVATAPAAAAARALPQTLLRRDEARLLNVPGMYMVALWLADEAGGVDLLIPLAPAPCGVQALHGYTAAELAEVLAARTRRPAAVGAPDS
ncbi:hypothetical protein [Embleya hyalina]|uniref:Uncharacterized protein n=1 Tax=Embleya hyalina TaxID=516124 RepID=A0A401YW45_9ACTN|nr:hypothetical protein [Embleya hyalina]GCD98801.1 hypothetical protein EHYA_06512 [Embleya hyalina]